MSAFLLSECVENSNVSLFVKTSHTLGGGWGVCVSSPLPFILAFRPTCSICPSAFLYSNTLIIKFPSETLSSVPQPCSCNLFTNKFLSETLPSVLQPSCSYSVICLLYFRPLSPAFSLFWSVTCLLSFCHLPSLFQALSPAFSLWAFVTCFLSVILCHLPSFL